VVLSICSLVGLQIIALHELTEFSFSLSKYTNAVFPLATAIHFHYTHSHRILNIANFSPVAYSAVESLQVLELPESRRTVHHSNMTRYATLHDDETEEVQLQQLTDVEAGTAQGTRRCTTQLPHISSASTSLQSSDMSNDRTSPSTTATASDAEEGIPLTHIHNLEATVAQDTYDSMLPPSYSGPFSAPLQNPHENMTNAQLQTACWDTTPRRRRCCEDCCTEEVIGPCVLFFVVVVLLTLFILWWQSESRAVAHTIEVFKSDCLAHGGSLQIHMDAHTKESFSCIRAGNDTVMLGG
jgi:hypothetical protein